MLSGTDILTLSALAFAGISAAAAWLNYRVAHGSSADTAFNDRVDRRVETAMNPFRLKAEAQDHKIAGMVPEFKVMLAEALAPVQEKLAVLGTRLEFIDDFRRELAVDAAKILHHPHPGRERIDYLLDAFTDNTLTADEETELRKHLVAIRNYEPGQDVGYPVYQGEQIAAAILLRTLQDKRPPRRAAQ